MTATMITYYTENNVYGVSLGEYRWGNRSIVKVATIKSLMSKISLPHAPSWAKDGQDQEWREKLG